MNIDSHLIDDAVVIEISGKIMGGESATNFHSLIREHLNNKKRSFVIDLEKTIWTNSIGIGMLIAGHTAVMKESGSFVLCNITNIQDLLSMTQLLKVFKVSDSRSEALSISKA